MKAEKVLLEIDEIIEAYTLQSESMSINELLLIQDKLSGYGFYFAEVVAKSKMDYNFGYLKRKIVINRATQSILDLKVEKAMNKAQTKAETQNEDLLRDELTLEGLAFEYDLKLKQLNRVLSAMQQRISFVKKEWELAKFQTN
tara:strand:- start:3454 stop:3882 length:429 start_codon:yes stop_codon:yes gene_type:complete